MASRLPLAALALALALALAGCSGVSPTPRPAASLTDVAPAAAAPTATYFPLAVGNKWVFSGRDYASSRHARFLGPTAAASRSSKSAYTAFDTVLSTTLFGGVAWFKIREGCAGDSYPLWLQHNAAGLAVRDTAPGVPGPTRYYIKAPIAVGTAWKSDGANLKITSTMGTVQVPAGRFTNCLVVQAKYPYGDTVVWYYRAGIGAIQMKETLSGNLLCRLDLNSYTLK